MRYLIFLFGTVLALGSQTLDAKYSYKNMVVAVVNIDKEPVYGEHVESELVKALRNEVRFEFSDKGYLFLKDGLKGKRPVLSDVDPNLPWSTIGDLQEQGTQNAILGEVFKDEKYKVKLWLVSTSDKKKVFEATAEVAEDSSLAAFSLAAREALARLLAVIPYDATVVRRDGYRVVLDRGRSIMRPGMELPVYTMEEREGKLLFEETGLIVIQRADENLSFGKIVTEKRPREIEANNKVRFPNNRVTQLSSNVLGLEEGREPSALFESSEAFEIDKGRLGFVHADLGPSLLSINSSNLSGGTTNDHSNTLLAPRGSLRADLWLTSRWFMNLGLGYGLSQVGVQGTTTSQTVGTSVTDFRLLFGYRLNVLAPERGPVLHVKGGYASQSYSFGTSTTLTVPYSDTTYAGIMLGGGVEIPIYDRWSGAFDVNTLIFPSVSNSRAGNATASNVAAWDFALRGIYSFNNEMDIEGKFMVQRNGAKFSGSSNVQSVSQTVVAGVVGLNYYY